MRKKRIREHRNEIIDKIDSMLENNPKLYSMLENNPKKILVFEKV